MKLGAVSLWLVMQCGAAPIPLYFLATDQTGAQTQIDVNHTSSWIMTPSLDFDFGGGLFSMKSGVSTSATVLLSLYEGADASGPLLASVDLSLAIFCAQVSNCGQYEFHQFFFSAPASLAVGTTYFAALTSSASDVQSLAYFIKNDSYFIADEVGAKINPQPVTFGSPSTIPDPALVPEPRPLTLMGIGLGLILWGAKPPKPVESRSSRAEGVSA